MRNSENDAVQKNTTIRDVAMHAGVSTATVSRVLGKNGVVSQERTEKVQNAVRALDYHPNRTARNLRKRVGQTIGVIISDIQNPFFTSVIRGIEKTLESAGYVLLLCNSDEDPKLERTHLATLRAEGVAGIILAPTRTDAKHYSGLLETGTPVVAIDRMPCRSGMDVVTVNNQTGTFTAVDHLISLGHRSIGMISGPRQLSTSAERLEGFKNAFRSHNLPLILEHIVFSDYRQTGGYAAMQTLLNLPNPPRAVLVANNLMTLGALQAIHEHDLKVPDEMALIGFDDMPWATSLNPPLTAVAQPTYELGAVASRLLLDRIQEPSRPYRQVVLETRLMVRASCGGSPDLLKSQKS